MNDGILCQLTLNCAYGESVECWGLIDGDEFLLIYGPQEAWGECGEMPTPVGLMSPEEKASVRHAPGNEPDEVLVALARYRLTGETTGFVNEELQSD